MVLKTVGLVVLVCIQFSLLTNAQNPPSQSYDDKRCKCICPSINSVMNNTQEDNNRILVIDNVPPNKCNCDSVILPKWAEKIKGKEQEFCPRCECKYENRNTTVIKVVVIIVIWIISLLSIYMLFLNLLEPILNKRAKANYSEHLNEEDDSGSVSGHHLPMVNVNAGSSRNNVLNRVTNQQDKWKRQVQEQRSRIYSQHSMLN